MLCQNDDSDFNVCLSAFTLGFLHLLGKSRKKSLQDTDNMWYTTDKYENVGYHADDLLFIADDFDICIPDGFEEYM